MEIQPITGTASGAASQSVAVPSSDSAGGASAAQESSPPPASESTATPQGAQQAQYASFLNMLA